MQKSFKVIGFIIVTLGLSMLLEDKADAAFVIDIIEQDGNVVLSGSGTLNIASLTKRGDGISSYTIPSLAVVVSGSPYSGFGDIFGPQSLGTGFPETYSSSSTGDAFGLNGSDLIVPENYESGSFLSGTSIWNNATLSSLGFTPGVYTWTWGSESTADTLTVNIVPEPSTWTFIGLGLIGAGLFRRRVALR
jgi:hypothetical protein